MNKLLDGIKRLKLARQVAEPPVEAQDEIDALIVMYAAIRPGESDLKRSFCRQWDELSEEKRAELVNRLLKMGILSQEFGYVLEFFKGKVVSLI